ncbi:MAG: hypothetical protein FJ271_26480 [Planctomycetes bacterium]|nr:hypothetical protein [Planctomycetota bacterium]
MIIARLSMVLFISASWAAAGVGAGPPIHVGSRLELFVDDALIERLNGAERRLHHPVPANVALICDRPWEGNWCAGFTVLRDKGSYRMYYRGGRETRLTKNPPDKQVDARLIYTCYAESRDGITWTRPSLGLFEVAGTRKNNVVFAEPSAINPLMPFVDTRPGTPPEQRYKAVATKFPMVSADGLRWRKLNDSTVIEGYDSFNLAFWDAERKQYRSYSRHRRGSQEQMAKGAGVPKTSDQGIMENGRDNGRDIITSTSKDFVNWTKPEFLSYSPGRISELYENNVLPYHRAPHLLRGFPVRYVDRGWTESAKALPQLQHRRNRAGAYEPREGTALTDVMLMCSRDGTRFSMWPESFIRPGLRLQDNWFYGDNFLAWGLIETPSAIVGAPGELSLFATEAFLQPGPVRLRRFTLRLDGFVSVRAPLAGGELLTRPVVFAGSKLVLNYSTSAAGSVRVELQDAQGLPLPGFALGDCHDIYGDQLERTVAWKGNPDLARFAGTPVRLRFELRDADLYSIQFRRAANN